MKRTLQILFFTGLTLAPALAFADTAEPQRKTAANIDVERFSASAFRCFTDNEQNFAQNHANSPSSTDREKWIDTCANNPDGQAN